MGTGQRRTMALMAVGVLAAVASFGQEIPQVLSGWREWAMRGEEHRRCPVLLGGNFGEPAQHPCAWPGRLRLEVGEKAARFSITWTVYQETSVPLPGSPEIWPMRVRLNGTLVPVLEHHGVPQVRVMPGAHLIEGELQWEQRPDSLSVPEEVALVDLLRDGRPVFPMQRDGLALWLGQAPGREGQAVSMAVQVYRLLTDGVPALLTTRIRLEVSGKGREEILGSVLPRGFVPISLAGDLAALPEADGRLRVQVRTGLWDLEVRARALAPLSQVEVPRPTGRWAPEEVWSYQFQGWFRVTSASGGRSVDPSQAGVPEQWRTLPAMILSPGETLIIQERSRGLAAQEAIRLQLKRHLWLDFPGGGANLRDLVSGRMERDFRLDLAEPFALTRATVQGKPVLVTAGRVSGWRGVELRDPNVLLEASARLKRLPAVWPVSGWQSPMESVSWNVHLPPGWDLVAALGADVSSEVWVSRWTVMDVFLVLITALLGWRLLGARGGLMTLAFLGLSNHESARPLWCLLALFGLALLERGVKEGRGARLIAKLLVPTLIVSAMVLLPFVGSQLRLALYPQLEVEKVASAAPPPIDKTPRVGGSVELRRRAESQSLGRLAGVEEARRAMRARLKEETAGDVPEAVSEQLLPTEQKEQAAKSQDRATMLQQRYAAANVFQAGGGEPSWAWRVVRLAWSGPVLSNQSVRLVLSPPWLTRTLRLLRVGLLGVLLVILAQALGQRKAAARAVGRSVLGLILLVAAVGSALAQSTPDPVLLEQLRKRLLEPPPCTPNCAVVAGATVVAQPEHLQVAVTVHAETTVAVPAPGAGTAWHIGEFLVDGAPVPGVLRRQDGSWWVPVAKGVHQVFLVGRLAATDTVELRFPSPPQRIQVKTDGWRAVGVWEGRLRSDTLTLVRSRVGGLQRKPATPAVPPFVRVTRELELDLDWSATTQVERIAPVDGSLTVEIPLLPGESVVSPGFSVKAGKVTAVLGPGVQVVSWRSRLERVPLLTLTSPDLQQRSERWRVMVSPQWRAEFRGVPPSAPARTPGIWVHQFDPLPGETLEVEVTQPAPVAAPTVAVDRCDLVCKVGQRARDCSLKLALRATRGGQYTITLPSQAQVLGVRVGGEALQINQHQGRLTVPVNPGNFQLEVRFRETRGIGVVTSLPRLGLGSPAANLKLEMGLPPNRWVLATSGPRVGPAVLYWGEVAVMALVALGLARLAWAPLTFTQWLLLGLGFSLFSWPGLAVVTAWLLALEARRRLKGKLPWWLFNLIQVALAVLTVAAVLSLLMAVPSGLLGTPDLHLTGNGSTPTHLRWFTDRSQDLTPEVAALSLPMWVYRLAMLAWALWLAQAVVGWLRWGWRCMNVGGDWRRRVVGT